MEAEAEETRLALFGDMHEGTWVAAACIKDGTRALDGFKAKLVEKGLHLFEVRRAETHIGNIGHTDHEASSP